LIKVCHQIERGDKEKGVRRGGRCVSKGMREKEGRREGMRKKGREREEREGKGEKERAERCEGLKY